MSPGTTGKVPVDKIAMAQTRNGLPRDDGVFHQFRVAELGKRCAACLKSLLADLTFCPKCRPKDLTS